MTNIDYLNLAIAVFGVVGGGSLSGAVIWGIRQEGRINAHDQRFETTEKHADERHEDVKARLDRIETLVTHLECYHGPDSR